MKCHPVFHVSLLEPTASNPLRGQKQPAPPPIIFNNNVEFEAEKILDSRRVYKALKYKFKWVGYNYPTWEPVEFLQNSPKLVHYFHKKYPKKPRPDNLPPV